MENVLCQYCDRSCFKAYSEDIFIRWLVDLLGPVLAGVKPAEIMSFKRCDSYARQKITSIEQHMTNLPTLSIRIQEISDGSTKVLFYHRESLDSYLNKGTVRRFLATEGYPIYWGLERCIDELLSRFENSEMPHEIGVFLGYPLKDVLGFLGRVKLTYQKTQGWQVFGDPTLSDRLYDEIQQARFNIRKRLAVESPFEILASA